MFFSQGIVVRKIIKTKFLNNPWGRRFVYDNIVISIFVCFMGLVILY